MGITDGSRQEHETLNSTSKRCLGVFVGLLLSTEVFADHDLGVFWFNDILVYDQFVSGGHEIRVIQMVDEEDLGIKAVLQTTSD